MLLLQQGNISQKFVVTISEKQLLANPYFIFVFTHTTTKKQVTVAYNYSDDLSSYPGRFNEFEINTSTVFAGQATGQWQYEVYECTVNTFSDGLTMLENGKMLLTEPSLSFTGRNPQTTFSGYAG